MTTARAQDTARSRPGERGHRELRQWDECSLLRNRTGVPWWGAVLCALGLTAIGVFVDIERLNRLGIVFQACYFLGCLLAVAVVQRKGLFGPMVQPPLILAVAVPGVVLTAGSRPTGGGTAAALAVGTPLINGFPTMAITTGLAIAIGVLRLITQRRPPAPRRPTPSPRPTSSPRTSPSPRPTSSPRTSPSPRPTPSPRRQVP